MINISDLIVMQYDVRNVKQIPSMVEFVRNGGIWNLDNLKSYATSNGLRAAPLMEISLFPDGKKMIHDGHHRAIATYLAGREFFYDEEFVTLQWNYSDYSDINFSKRWVTPFDPRTHLRDAEIFTFKNKALEIYQTSGEDAALEFIKSHKYVKPRDIDYLPELARKFKNREN